MSVLKFTRWHIEWSGKLASILTSDFLPTCPGRWILNSIVFESWNFFVVAWLQKKVIFPVLINARCWHVPVTHGPGFWHVTRAAGQSPEMTGTSKWSMTNDYNALKMIEKWCKLSWKESILQTFWKYYVWHSFHIKNQHNKCSLKNAFVAQIFMW